MLFLQRRRRVSFSEICTKNISIVYKPIVEFKLTSVYFLLSQLNYQKIKMRFVFGFILAVIALVAFASANPNTDENWKNPVNG